MQAKIQKWGNSQGVRFPKQILRDAQLSLNDELDISVYEGKIIIEPINRTRNKYTIKNLVSKMPENYLPEELDWGKPTGKEEW